MEAIERSLIGNKYSVAYDCGRSIFKVVRVNEGASGFSENTGRLQIQQPGIEIRVEILDFKDGNPRTRDTLHDTGSSTGFVTDEKREELLKRFGREFKEVFQHDGVLQRYIGNFEALRPYL